MSEEQVVNKYTYRQAIAMCEFIIKEKFAVVAAIASSFGGKKSKDISSKSVQSKSLSRGLPSWYKPKSRNSLIVDLDGPMESLNPYLGKNKIVKKNRSLH